MAEFPEEEEDSTSLKHCVTGVTVLCFFVTGILLFMAEEMDEFLFMKVSKDTVSRVGVDLESFEFSHSVYEYDETDHSDYHAAVSTNDDHVLSINYTYYHQWYGSPIADHTFRIGAQSMQKCRIPSMIFVWNHKSGGYFKEWLHTLKQICGVSYKEYYTSQLYRSKPWNANKKHPDLQTQIKAMESKWRYSLSKSEETILIGMRESDPTSLKAAVSVFNEIRPLLDYVILFMIRNPLSTILSGYNYHGSGKEKTWTDKVLKEIHVRFERPLMDCFRDIWDQKKYVIDKDSTMYKEYKKGFRNNYSDHEALQYGLYLEFTRFVNCEWPTQIAAYREIKNNADRKYKWFLFLRFEWFHDHNYKESIQYLLEQLSSYDSEGIRYVQKELEKSDISTLCSGEGNKKQCDHMSKGKYDPELQIRLLMSYDERICPKLKKMTFRIGGQWVGMDDYC